MLLVLQTLILKIKKVAAGIVDIIGKIVTLGRIPTRLLTFADNYFKNIEYQIRTLRFSFREAVKNRAGVFR